MEVTVTSKYCPDETIFFSWAARPSLFCNRNGPEWPVVLSGVLAPEYRDVIGMERSIVSSYLPEHAALSIRMIGDASGYSSGETAGSSPVPFKGVVNIQTERVDSDMIQVKAEMLEGNWPTEGAIAWVIRAAPSLEDASRFHAVFGCASLVFDSGKSEAKTRISAGTRLPRDDAYFVAALLGDALDMNFSFDWEEVDDYSFTLIGKRDMTADETCTILVDWEVTGQNP
jgi:hypothetical protein